MKYFAHIITGEHDSGRGPEITILTEDGQRYAKYRPIEDGLLSALNILRGCGWTVFANLERKGTGYCIAEVAEPA